MTVRDEEWARVKRRARRQFGIGAAELEALSSEYSRAVLYVAFSPELAPGPLERLVARWERKAANRAAWLKRRLSENGKKGAAARWGRSQQKEQT